MQPLQHLRECRTIVRWMLVCFCLSIGVAIASPVVHPQGLTLVCTTAGSVKFVATGDLEAPAADTVSHTLDCVMCLPAGAPPTTAVVVLAAQDLTQTYLQTRPVVLQWRLAAKTSARDPPRLS